MKHRGSVAIGRFVRGITRLRGGAGSALPGLVVEKIDKNFVRDYLDHLEHGVVVVSGTNGKTTTTKMVVELLESQSLKVFTNKTGSNFVRGVIAAILENVDKKGKLDADIAVLELDEAHAVRFIEIVRPRYSLLLNVMRDQLDRFGEIDHTAKLLSKVAAATTDSVVINSEDPRLKHIESTARKVYYGLDRHLRSDFVENSSKPPDTPAKEAAKTTSKLILSSVQNSRATFTVGNKSYSTKLAAEGIYNAYNATAALTLVSTILPDISIGDLLAPLSKVAPAYGRGESFTINGQEVKLILVKNPSGFQLALKSFNSKKFQTFIAVNDNYADGRDMSWLWDVDFRSLDSVELVSGVRATDMALRLKYDDVAVGIVDPDLTKLSSKLRSSTSPTHIFATYSAMLAIRKLLSGKSIL